MPTHASPSLASTQRHRAVTLALLAAAAALSPGCGGDSNDGDAAAPATSSSTTPSGRFVDAAVANLGYTCNGLVGAADKTGVTDSLGQFDYVAGQSCSFSVGGVMLGSGTAATLMTPYSLVPGSAPGVPDTAVTNITRFLMSIDTDANPNNGIALTAEVNHALAGRALDFASRSFDADAAALIAQAIPSRALVDAGTAQGHLDLSLLGLYAGGYACTYRGLVNGADTLLGNVSISIADGVVTGAGTPIGSTSTFEIAGRISASGAANLTAGTTSTGAAFRGDFVTDGTVGGTKGSGTWNDPDLGSGTWACQHS